MKLWGEEVGETMRVFKGTFYFTHPPELSVFVLYDLARDSEGDKNSKTKTTTKNSLWTCHKRCCSGLLMREPALCRGGFIEISIRSFVFLLKKKKQNFFFPHRMALFSIAEMVAVMSRGQEWSPQGTACTFVLIWEHRNPKQKGSFLGCKRSKLIIEK